MRNSKENGRKIESRYRRPIQSKYIDFEGKEDALAEIDGNALFGAYDRKVIYNAYQEARQRKLEFQRQNGIDVSEGLGLTIATKG